jgi:hypothetical protein
MGFVGPAIGLGTSIFGAIMGHKSRKATDAASAQAGNAFGQLQGQSGQLFNQGLPMAQNAGGYFNTLLRGNRAAMSQAVAGPAAQITDNYRGAEKSLEHMGIRGGEAATARAEMSRDRASQVAGLTTGVQPMAAQALGNLGTNLIGQGQTGLAEAGSGYSNLMRNRLASQGQAYDQNTSAGEGIGRSIGEMITVHQNKSGGGGLPGEG